MQKRRVDQARAGQSKRRASWTLQVRFPWPFCRVIASTFGNDLQVLIYIIGSVCTVSPGTALERGWMMTEALG